MTEPGRGPTPLLLRLLPNQSVGRSTLFRLGFQANPERDGLQELARVVARGFVDSSTWANFVAKLRARAGISLPTSMPTFETCVRDGVLFSHGNSGPDRFIGLSDLELSLSPVLLLFPGRGGVIVPIREKYAEALLVGDREQYGLFPHTEALLRSERTYFRSSASSSKAARGNGAIFYASRGGGSKAIGCARITKSVTLTKDEALIRFGPQGVLDDKQMDELSKGERIHAISFSSFQEFPRPVEFKELRDLGCGKNNFQTLEAVDSNTLQRICALGFLNA